ncbi:MAG: exodeoxyribonuclease VII small subunit [Oscillospiraceae bacterium]
MKNTFESASTELSEILDKLSNDETPLDEALNLYAKAAKLIAFCNDTLQNAKIRIEEIDGTTNSLRGEQGEL